MPLAARLNSPLALFGKLEREAYRSFHAKTPLHKADHFFNFCITAASMRDYVLEHLQKISSQDAKPYYDSWAKVPALVGAAEIANSAKHFVLREKRTGHTKTVQTRGVGTTKAGFIDVYASPDGDVKLVETWRSEITVTLSDGQVLQLYKFTEEVLPCRT